MSGTALAQSAWTGGDDLPTSPLACDGTPAAAAAKPYDGGAPTNPPDRKGKKITVVDVPKLIGIGYFNATSKGIARRGRRTRQCRCQDRRPDQGQHRRADHLHRQLHHQRRRRHPVRRQRSGGHCSGAEEGAGEGHQRGGL
jgi:hypothetical protein